MKNLFSDLSKSKKIENVLRKEQFEDYKLIFPVLESRKGFLVTNGTGTGKTFIGGSLVKRFAKKGNNNILILCPTDNKCKDWIADLDGFGLIVNQIASTKDKGIGIVVTTYTNLRDNKNLYSRHFDIVIADESHNLMSNQEGKVTKTLKAFRECANIPSVCTQKSKDKFKPFYVAVEQELKSLNNGNNLDVNLDKREQKETELKQRLQKIKSKFDSYRRKLFNSTKVLFLSATPFPYVLDIRYADGILFELSESFTFSKLKRGSRFAPSNEQKFFIDNFSYRFHNGTLLAPNTDVDTDQKEREFAEKMLNGKVSITRILNVDYDYSRQFVEVGERLGKDIDSGMAIIHNNPRLSNLKKALLRKWNFLYTNQIFESLKVSCYLERIKQHLDLGRKVVIFHQYKKNISSHPFDFSSVIDSKYFDIQTTFKIQEEIKIFNTLYPKYKNLDLGEINGVIKKIKNNFGGGCVFYNGDINKTKRLLNIKRFNKDPKTRLIVIQIQSGKEGISLHDTIGDFQRVLISFAYPYKPTDAIQMEGRIYRIGVLSDAIFEYPILKTIWEGHQIALKVSKRVKTPENLALGFRARGLHQAFKQGYINSINEPPNIYQGVGGKVKDFQFKTKNDYDLVESIFSSKEERDYQEVPEPLAFKMIEWAGIKPKERLLNPYAGNGSFALSFPIFNYALFIEPDYNKRGNLMLNCQSKEYSILTKPFLDLSLINKFDCIFIKPDFSNDLIKVIQKAIAHINKGGKLIAVLPDSKEFNAFLNRIKIDNQKEISLSVLLKIPEFIFKEKSKVIMIQRKPIVMEPKRSTVDLSTCQNEKEFYKKLKKVRF